MKLNTTRVVELLSFGSVEGWGWESVEMGRGDINRRNLNVDISWNGDNFFLVLFTLSDVLSIKFLESRTSGHLWPLRLFMRTDGDVATVNKLFCFLPNNLLWNCLAAGFLCPYMSDFFYCLIIEHSATWRSRCFLSCRRHYRNCLALSLMFS